MKDIATLVVVHSRLYPSDALHLERLLIASVHKRLVEAGRFKSAGVDDKQGTIQFGGGEFVHGDATFLVEALVFEDRRMTLKFHGPSRIAEACFEALLAVMGELGIAPAAPAVLATNDSSFVATLGFDFREVFVPAVRTFIDQAVPCALAIEGTDVVVTPRAFTLHVLYQDKDTGALERYLSHAPRLLTIEPRLRTALSERRYFCSAPTDSDTLVRLVEEFESSMVSPR